MALEDLEEHGVLLPDEERGTHPDHAFTPRVPLVAASSLALAGCVAMYLGGGRLWTWIGLAAFFAGFFVVILLSDRAVAARRQRIEEIREDLGSRGGDREDASAST